MNNHKEINKSIKDAKNEIKKFEKEIAQQFKTFSTDMEQKLNLIQFYADFSDGDTQTEKNKYDDRYGIFAEVMMKGGVVTSDEWFAIGKTYGREACAMNCYCVGGTKINKIGGNRYAISDNAMEEVREWLKSDKATKEQKKKYAKLLG